CHPHPSPPLPPPPSFLSPPLPRPPPPTLVPYTTLFRSPREPDAGHRRRTAPAIPPRPLHRAGYRRGPGSRSGAGGRHQIGFQALDRKSTRLNSSHVSISYAVFCLKKKND